MQTSLAALISKPSSYEGQIVRVSGYLKIQEENTNLFYTPMAAQEYDDKQCIALLIPIDKYDRYSRQLNNRFGEVIGKFVAAACSADSICPWFCDHSPGIEVQSISRAAPSSAVSP